MTTPAGWYDDGSGRQRWWDGTQWTEHFAPVAETPQDEATTPEATTPEAAAETEQAIESVASVETSWSAAPATEGGAADADPTTSPAPDTSEAPLPEPPASADFSMDAQATESPEHLPVEDVAQPEPTDVEAPAAPSDQAPAWETPSAPAATPAWDAQPATPFEAPGATGPTSPHGDAVPPYATAAPAYPAAAPAYPGAPPAYPGAAPAYPAAAPAYPGAGYPPGAPVGYTGAYAAAPAAPARVSVLGLVGLGLAALGTILAFVPIANIFGFVLLAGGFIVSLISLFLKGRKWPGITGLALSVVGTVIGFVMIFVFTFATVAGITRDVPSSPSSSEPSTDDGYDGGYGTPEVVEASMGEPVTITQYEGVAEVTVNSATWATSDGSSIPSTNGGFVVLDVTWAATEGTTYISPIYFEIETAEGVEGSYDYFADGELGSDEDEIAAGQSVDGTVTFDVAQSSSYTVIVTDELLQEVARITVTPTAG